MRGDSTVTLQGRDSLTVKVIGKNKLIWEALIDRCKDFLEAYGRKDYETLFPNSNKFSSRLKKKAMHSTTRL
jgi:hypothetical protein